MNDFTSLRSGRGTGAGIGVRSKLQLVPAVTKPSASWMFPTLAGASPDARPMVIDINQRVRDLLDTIDALCGRDVSVELDLEPRRPLSRIDAADFDSVLLDLVALARGALEIPVPAFGRRDAAGAVPLGQISIRTRCVANRVWLMIADTGVKRRFTGLGPMQDNVPGVAARAVDLRRVCKLVARGRGHVRARSCRGRGAAVLVIMPAMLGLAAGRHNPNSQQPQFEQEEEWQ